MDQNHLFKKMKHRSAVANTVKISKKTWDFDRINTWTGVSIFTLSVYE